MIEYIQEQYTYTSLTTLSGAVRVWTEGHTNSIAFLCIHT